ncbi:Putative amidoligase enzyme [Planctomycetes bacterium Poly30]|uniref:Amidoligase enzyme n=1 Tax=Saltatorellus ferox TaxID=2528018 RepID=A0A518EZ13_9BACT|nr:Putative amidoligase enzyme [Planctomycetes bacterium Poly30]
MIERDKPLPLPVPENREGKPRRVGVEIELGALREDAVARTVADVLGGEVAPRDDKGYQVEGTSLGKVEVYLDTQYLRDARTAIQRGALKIAQAVVPVEIVTEPILPEEIAELDRLVDRLREDGGTGTGAGWLLGFGLHFNPEVTGFELEDVGPTVTAFALLEDWYRREVALDISRRAMPYIDSYPSGLVDGLAADEPRSMEDLIDLYLRTAPSRNHGLDMLCLFSHLDAERVAEKVDTKLIGSRPTYHFRLPDCRLDEEDWSVALEWNRWVRVERIAQQDEVLERLKAAWTRYRAQLLHLPGSWADEVAELIQEYGG